MPTMRPAILCQASWHASSRENLCHAFEITIGHGERGPLISYMDTATTTRGTDVDLLHEMGSRIAASDQDALHEVLDRLVEFAAALVKCDSCFIYVQEQEELVLRASKNPHQEVVDRLKLRVGQGITGWVAEHHTVVAVPLLCRGRLVGVINLQHIRPHIYKQRDIQLISTVGFLVGAEIEMARLESANTQLSERLETRKLLGRAKGILQRDIGSTEEQAYLRLQQQSRQTRKSMKQIAEAIILSDEVKRSSKSAS